MKMAMSDRKSEAEVDTCKTLSQPRWKGVRLMRYHLSEVQLIVYIRVNVFLSSDDKALNSCSVLFGRWTVDVALATT
jgi:hypothetical protein